MILDKYSYLNKGGGKNMAIVRWQRPLPSSLQSFFDDNLFAWPELSTVEKGLNIYETDNEVVVEAAVPGVPEDKVEVMVEGNVLTITANYEETQEETAKKKVVYKSNRQTAFRYSTSLPRMVMGKDASAVVENGVVTVTIPKTEEEKPRKVNVTRRK